MSARTMAAAGCLVALLLPGCTGGHHHRAKPAATRHTLPPGFTRGPAPRVTLLPAATVTHLDVAKLHRAPLPRGQVQDVTRAVVNQPVPAGVRPLLVSDTRLRPGRRLTVAAARLPTAAAHDALLILQGPGYRGERLVRVHSGLAAATLTLPRSLRAGTWAIAMEDLSAVTKAPHQQVTGTVAVGLGIFQVG